MACLTGKRVGTCDDTGCTFHGVCHCGCGSVMKLSTHNHRPDTQYPCGMTKGMPYMHRAGHTSQSKRNMNDPRFNRLTWYQDADRARELIDLLVGEHGTVTAAARSAGLARDTLVKLRGRRIDRVWPQTMRALELAWDRADRPQRDNLLLPTQPLRDYLTRQGISTRLLPPTQQRRLFRERISVWNADEMASDLGQHIGDIWPDYFELESA